MSNYESNPAGLGVGKRYGPLYVGGLTGCYRGDGALHEVIYSVAGNEVLTLESPLPEGYLIEAIYYEVEAALATGAEVAVTVDGGTAATEVIALDAESALVELDLTGMTNLSSTDAATLEFTPNAAAEGSVEGYARVLVRFKSI